jgi:hypothetical protein
VQLLSAEREEKLESDLQTLRQTVDPKLQLQAQSASGGSGVSTAQVKALNAQLAYVTLCVSGAHR